MAYQTYTTDALVVGSENRLTADRICVLLTREVGLLYARAAGLRRERSKLRFCLQDFSLVRVSLVRGARGWRLTGAEEAHNLYFSIRDRAAHAALVRTLRLLRRLVRGEEHSPALYDALRDGLFALALCVGAEAERGERVLALRLVSALGYVSPERTLGPLLSARTLSDALAVPEEHREAQVVRSVIARALAASQL